MSTFPRINNLCCNRLLSKKAWAVYLAITVLAFVLLAGLTHRSPAGPISNGVLAQVSSEHPVYSETLANELLELMFPRSVRPSSTAAALDNPRIIERWRTVEDSVTQQTEVQLPTRMGNRPVHFAILPIESYWMIAGESDERALALLKVDRVDRLNSLLEKLGNSKQLYRSTLEKALLQRDLFHIESVFVSARLRLKEDTARLTCDRIIAQLSTIIRRQLLLTVEELAELKTEAARRSSLEDFHSSVPVSRDQNYLPVRVVADDETWWPLNFHLKYHVHYGKYRGRSFFKTYGRVPGMSHDAFRDYWHTIATKYGSTANTDNSLPKLPSGSEFLLIRTMGVIIQDGTIADSDVIEEVVIRRFLTKAMEFDPKTSDYRGTQHFQYIMDRALCLSNPDRPGLRRIADDDPAYLGFFAGAPDFQTSWNEHMTTARFNCIICHSESQYGAPTVFSLGFEEVRHPEYLFDGHPFAFPDEQSGRTRLKTEEFQTLWNAIHVDE